MNKLFEHAHFDASGAAIPDALLSDFVLVFIDDIQLGSKLLTRGQKSVSKTVLSSFTSHRAPLACQDTAAFWPPYL